MHGEPYFAPTSSPWNLLFLSVAALSSGVLIGFRYVFPQVQKSSQLVLAGLIVAVFTVTSLLCWYDTTESERKLHR